MLARELCRVLDVLKRKNFAGEVRLHDVLQPRHLRMIEKAAARANIRIDMPRVRWILPPVAELIAVGVQNRIELQRLNWRSPWRKHQKQNDLCAAKRIRVSFDLFTRRP